MDAVRTVVQYQLTVTVPAAMCLWIQITVAVAAIAVLMLPRFVARARVLAVPQARPIAVGNAATFE